MFPLFILHILLAALLACIPALSQTPAASIADQSLSRVYNGKKPPERQGAFDFSLSETAPAVGIGYVNVVVDLNEDSIIDSYPTSGGEAQREWIIRNVPVLLSSREQAYSIPFEFPDLTIPANVQKSCAVLVTDKAMAPGFPLSMDQLVSWERMSTIVVGATGKTALKSHRGVAYQRRGAAIGAGFARSESNLTGDNEADGVPDIQQRINECGPTASANSLIWLSRRHGFAAMLPHHADGSVDTTKMILELMQSMAGTDVRPFQGLKANQMFDGNQKYASSLHLPVTIIGGNGDPEARGNHVFDFVESHQDSVIGMQLLIWRKDGEGHWVTVTGSAFDDGRAFLYVHDPDDRKTAGVVWELKVDGDGSVTDHLLFPQGCTLGWVVAELAAKTEIASAMD